MSRCLSIVGNSLLSTIRRSTALKSMVASRPCAVGLLNLPVPAVISPQIRGFSHGPPLSKPMIEDRVLLVLQLYDKINPEKLTLKSDLAKDFGLDSLDLVEVNVAMEEEFSFDIPAPEFRRLRTPFDIVQYICDKHDIYD